MSAEAYPWGTRVEFRDEDGTLRHGVVDGITGLVGHIRVGYRKDNGQITRVSIPESAVVKAYPPEVTA